MNEPQGKADVGKRIGAVLIDGLVIAIPQFILSSVLGWVVAFVVASAAALYLYGWRMGETGTTPGKQAMGLKIVDASTGELLGNQRGLQRTGLIWILGIWILGLAAIIPTIGLLFSLLAVGDVIVALMDDRGQRFTDRIVGSVVTHA